MELSSYPKVYAIGHKALKDADVFNGDVVVQEKIDGSQFSFGAIGGEIVCRSKNVMIDLDDAGMFGKAVQTVLDVSHSLVPGWTYRAEFVSKPKHNTLVYDHVPPGYLIGYDVETSEPSVFLTQKSAKQAFGLLDLSYVPVYYEGPGDNVGLDMLEMWAAKGKPVLGGEFMEGLVIKNYSAFTRDGKVAMAKYVQEKFKERHAGDWKKRNPNRADVVQMLIDAYSDPARYGKARQHLEEQGVIAGEPSDIGPLMKEFSQDLLAECQDEIKDVLFSHFWKQIQRGASRGLPQWYKDELAKSQFDTQGE